MVKEIEKLNGGRKGKIFKQKNEVIRPANVWTPTVHSFLKHMIHQGATFVPIPYGIEEQQERVSFIAGDVYNDPLPAFFYTDTMLQGAAQLLAIFHQISESYITHLTGKEKWMLEVQTPIEVICHGDFAPYNTVIDNNKHPYAIIDFDTAHPGSKVWDLSYALYRWVPLYASNAKEKQTMFATQVQKANVFLDAYQATKEMRETILDVLIQRLESLMQYIQTEADAGNMDFQNHIDAGDMQQYRKDIVYITTIKESFTAAII